MNRIPPFGCAIVCFKTMPRIKYHLDFGNALGGSYSAGAIKAVIASIVDSVLLSMFVWPNRFIVSALAGRTCLLACLLAGDDVSV
jgi:hypothetical protein